MSDWISVKERLPEPNYNLDADDGGPWYAIKMKSGLRYAARYCTAGMPPNQWGEWVVFNERAVWMQVMPGEVEYWYPLPEPPKADEEL
jgi:hypothetical protein